MLHFYRCNTCGNLIEIIDPSGVIPICCGQPMTSLRPGHTDTAWEKHVPICVKLSEAEGSCDTAGDACRTLLVRVGETPHPMTEEHFIQWIVLHTDQGIYRKPLEPDMPPEATFLLQKDEQISEIYAYCNKHGLWVNILL